ncbi:MAG: 3-oxo-tetronate kinase [Pseudomonadota bacterium]
MKNKVFFGAIADDFTGATDLAAMLARSGAPVSLRLGLEGLSDDAPLSAFEVVALKCRTTPVDEAVGETREALRWLKAKGAERFFWKYCSTFDSTDKGNIGPVSEALMTEIGATQTIYCPAFPQNGRSIYNGYLYVGDELLSDSPMRDHPLTPMRDSNLMRLLTPQVTQSVGLVGHRYVRDGAEVVVNQMAALADAGVVHVVTDAIDDAHLTTLAKACRDMPFLTGGSAIAAPLPDLYRADGHITFDPMASSHQETADAPIILSGSCSAMTRKQVEIYKEQHPAFKLEPLTLATNGAALANAKNWLEEQPVERAKLIYATAEPEEVQKAQDALGREKAGAVVEHALSELANHAKTLGARRFVVAGGETSGAVVQRLGIRKVDIGPEIAPGVPWTFAKLDGATIAVALKSGNFGEQTFFEDALTALAQTGS